MSEVRLVIRDVRRDIHGTCHGGFADAVVAALAADPETIQELDVAVGRFHRPTGPSFFRGFREGLNDEPHDAGLMVIDLAARLVVCDSTYSAVSHRGTVRHHDGTRATDFWLNYQLSDDWLVTSDAPSWRSLADERRAERTANPPLDARAVLYGRPLLEFLAAESLAAHPSSRDGYETTKDIHARWLLTPRDDLRGRTPRELILARQDFISRDLDHRARQWSELGECPRGLDPDSAAFRFGGFGTHEWVKYYDLIRFLLGCCRSRLDESVGEDFVSSEVVRLEAVREKWFDTPDPECHGRTTRQIIDRERARLPEGVSPREAIVDHDCPMCEMMADMPGPMFWHLDGSAMEWDFAFSSHLTREEWEREQREYEEFSRQCDERRERERLETANEPVVWQRSFAGPDSPDTSPSIRLYGIAALLAELIEDLKDPPEDRWVIDRLNRDFRNLNGVVCGGDESLLEPVVDRLRETLTEVAAAREDLLPKCDDLGRRLRGFLEQPEWPGDDIPF